MKRFLCWVLLGLIVASPALAVPSVVVSRTPGTYPVAPLSGEFTLIPNAELQVITGGAPSFQSFCIEAHESVTVGNTYDVAVNNKAILGDGLRPGELPAPGGGDLLSPESAYLYTEFRGGTLAGYDYTPGGGREGSALSLQTAFWYLEGEVGYQDIGALSPQAQAFIAAAQASGWTTIGGVRVLNLFAGTTGKEIYQDMLTMTVPVPGGMLLGAIGACLIGWLRRRRTL
jgi:hypothetical protein